jgi:hypothetical protein
MPYFEALGRGGFMWRTTMRIERTTMRIERSETVDGEPGLVWALLSSPAAWSLWPHAPFVFAVPGAPALRLFIGPNGRGLGNVLFETCDEVPGAMVRLRTLPTGRQEFTLSVAAGRRGTAKASVLVKEVVPRQQVIAYEVKRRNDIKNWLSAVRAVIEGRAPWPGADMPADLRLACMARPHINHAQSASASALINADPATVWDAVQSPETARSIGPTPAIWSGHVPGTPQGEAGEMQYFVHRRDGQLRGAVVVVTEVNGQCSALMHDLGPLQLEQHYLLTPESESGPTRLDLTFRWQAPELTDAAEAARSQTAEAVQALASDYKSLIETAGEQA